MSKKIIVQVDGKGRIALKDFEPLVATKNLHSYSLDFNPHGHLVLRFYNKDGKLIRPRRKVK